MPRRRAKQSNQYFDPRRTKDAHGDVSKLQGNPISLKVPPLSTHFDHIVEICRVSQKPIPIRFVCEKLKEFTFPRGNTYFGELVTVIEGIVANYPGLKWWLETEGLVVDEIQSALGSLPPFDRFAGPLVLRNLKGGKLSRAALAAIAAKLDAEGFLLSKDLQPAQRKPIAEYNRKFPQSPIKTFSAAIERPHLVRGIRRRLYVACDRYKKASLPAESLFL